MSVFIFFTFCDKPITSLLILRIQAGSSPADACLDIFNSNTPYPRKERRAKPLDVCLWILPFLWSHDFENPIEIMCADLIPWRRKCQRSQPGFFSLEYISMAFWHFSFFLFFSFLRVKVLLIFSIDFPTLPNFEEKGSYWLVWSAQTPNVSCTRAIFVEIHRSPWLFPRVDEKKSPRNIALLDDSFH